MKIFQRGLALFFLFAVVRCGSGAVAPTCSGSSCICASGGACDISESACGTQASCSLSCTSHTDCSGACGDSCSVTCSGGATCAITVGQSGNVSCSGGATCHLTCTGVCSVSCSGGATCDLTCPGDTAAKPIAQSGQCTG